MLVYGRAQTGQSAPAAAGSTVNILGVPFVHESSHPHCSMPDLSPHKAHKGIQICQAQQVRGLRLCCAHKSDRAGAAQYLIFNLLGLSQSYHFYVGFPTLLLVPLQPCRQTKQRNARGLELQRIQGNQDVDNIHIKSS